MQRSGRIQLQHTRVRARTHTHAQLLLYPDNEQSEREIRKTVQFMMASKRIKYSEITKEVNLIPENYKTLLKERLK